MTYEVLLQNISNGFAYGCLYALIAIGYTMVYGILRLINFAHGNIFTTGAYLAYVFYSLLSGNWILAFILAMSLTAVLGVVTDRIAYKPIRNAPRISALISAIAVSFIIENLLVIIFGGRPLAFPKISAFDKIYNFGGITIPSINIAIVLISAIVLILLMILLYKTKSGLAMRALASDFDTARLMAMDVDKIVALTFIIGSALAALGGIMYASKFPQIHPYLATMPGLKAFIAAVVGGIGNVQGAFLGGLLLGLIEILFVGIFPALSGYRDAIAFIALIVILLYKPTGIMGGKSGRAKV
jgi:branched-chain amino acid transport system permease protein